MWRFPHSLSPPFSSFGPFPVHFIYQDIEYKFSDQYAKRDEELATFRNSIPVEILDMKIGDLKRMVSCGMILLKGAPLIISLFLQAFPTFAEVMKFVEAEKKLKCPTQLDMSVRDEGKSPTPTIPVLTQTLWWWSLVINSFPLPINQSTLWSFVFPHSIYTRLLDRFLILGNFFSVSLSLSISGNG